MSGGYDVDLFVEVPDCELICTICRCVLRCPVRMACSHVFCKSCILQWIQRQDSCPCCRKPVSPSLMMALYKLNKTIGRLRVKCANEGCSSTFLLSEELLHSSSCLFQEVPCLHQGCSAQVPRHHLESHARHCSHWIQLCPMGCGTTLTQATRAQHNCYRQLKQQVEAQRRSHRAIARALGRKMSRVQSAITHMKRQVALISKSLDWLEGGVEGGEEGERMRGGEESGEREGEEETTDESSTSSNSSNSSP
ncbi:RING finger protein 151 isoform X1 [Osmerus eperlanus]|uniref:RING finger protein 151 isoform X1 n=1 Tax=Osmerus eperlanus TaxID=29151 RepID=UPI002E0FA568